MLSYEDFKASFVEKFPGAMGEGYDGYTVRCMTVNKAGRELDGVTFDAPKVEGSTTPKASPVFYFNDMYEDHIMCGVGVDDLVNTVADSMRKALTKAKSVASNVDLSAFKKNVICELVGGDFPSDRLNAIPHRAFHDMYIIYRWVVGIDDTGVYSGIVDRGLMEYLELDEEALYSFAVKNTPRLFPVKLTTFKSVVRKTLKRDGKSDSQIRKCMGKYEAEGMYVVSNKHDFRGANAMLFPKALKKIADKVETSFYIIPTSANDLMVISSEAGMTIKQLRDIFFDSLNEECITNTIFYYDKDTESVEPCKESLVA